MAKKDQKSAFFSFLAITFEIIKILTSSFHWWATIFMLNPGIPNMAIFEVDRMVSINVKSGHKWPFLDLWAIMDTLKTTSGIAMLGIPGLHYQLKNNPKQGFCEKYVMGNI